MTTTSSPISIWPFSMELAHDVQLTHDAAADDDDVVADLDLALLDGVEDAGKRLGEAGLLDGHIVGHEVDLRDVGVDVLGKASHAHDVHLAHVDVARVGADVGLVMTAAVAVAAAVEHACGDALPEGELVLLDALAQLDDGAGELMASHEGQRHGDDAGEHALLERAEGAAVDLDEDLVLERLGTRDLAHLGLVIIDDSDDVHLLGHAGLPFSECNDRVGGAVIRPRADTLKEPTRNLRRPR